MSVADLSIGSKLVGYRVKPGAWRPARPSERFQPTLAKVQPVSSVGQIWLDENRQAVGTVCFGRYLGYAGGGIALRRGRVVANVDEIFGGRCDPGGPLPGRRWSSRKRGDPLPRAGSG
jgi:hypothetical protein